MLQNLLTDDLVLAHCTVLDHYVPSRDITTTAFTGRLFCSYVAFTPWKFKSWQKRTCKWGGATLLKVTQLQIKH